LPRNLLQLAVLLGRHRAEFEFRHSSPRLHPPHRRHPLDRRARTRSSVAALAVVLLGVVLPAAGVIAADRLLAIVVGVTVVTTGALLH